MTFSDTTKAAGIAYVMKFLETTQKQWRVLDYCDAAQIVPKLPWKFQYKALSVSIEISMVFCSDVNGVKTTRSPTFDRIILFKGRKISRIHRSIIASPVDHKFRISLFLCKLIQGT